MIDLFYPSSGIFLLGSGVSYLGYKKESLSLGLFGVAFLTLAIRTMLVGGDYFLLISNLAIAVIFIAKAFSGWKRASQK